jgi:hypothetical protein
MRLSVLEIKLATQVGYAVMPVGMYRTRRLASQRTPEDRGRGSGYGESPATLERAFQEALERNRQRLDEQREEIRRTRRR